MELLTPFGLFLSVLLTPPPLPDPAELRANCIETVSTLASINSGSKNLEGLNQMAAQMSSQLTALGMKVNWNPESRSFEAISAPKKPQATILLLGHIDTVFEADHPFQKVRLDTNLEREDYQDQLIGPGVADDKGGLFLIQRLIQMFRGTELEDLIQWKVFLEADEEVGSRLSRESLAAFATGSTFAIVFEPGWYDFKLRAPRVIDRVGGNMHLHFTIEGPETHPGTSESLGLSTNDLLAKLISSLGLLRNQDISVNFFEVQGQSKSNVTAPLSTFRVSLRYRHQSDEAKIHQFIEEIRAHYSRLPFRVSYELKTSWHPQIISSPEVLARLQKAAAAAKQKPLVPATTMARGAGAFLAKLGLPTLDAMGPFGAALHSSNEALLLESVHERLDLLRHLVTDLLKR